MKSPEPPSPVRYPPRATRSGIALDVVILLRHVSAGVSVAAAAREVGSSVRGAYMRLRRLREHYGVTTNEQLLELPDVQRQLVESVS